MKPVLKWPGSKRQLVERLVAKIPQDFQGRIFEPFVGAGALFFHYENVPGRRWVLSDTNTELIAFYRVLRDDVEGLIARARYWEENYRNEHDYYRIRELCGAKQTPVDRAVRVLYLNKMAFNGIWRENSRGEHNVPYNQKPTTKIIDEEALRAAGARLAGARLLVASFEDAVEKGGKDFGDGRTVAPAKAGDLVYMDPPYVPLRATASFTTYHKLGFGEVDQRRLADCIVRIHENGIKVILSNSRTPTTELIYNKCFQQGTTEGVQVRRMIAADSSRPLAGELLCTTYLLE